MECEDITTETGEDIEMAEPSHDLGLDNVFMSDPHDQSTKLADLLIWSYALHLRTVMDKVAEKHCSSCYYNHPSQLEHDVCVLMDFDEQVHQWFDEALAMADEDLVIGKWLQDISTLWPTVWYHEVS